MGKHHDISPERLRADLLYFARFMQRMDEEGRLLDATPRIIQMMGDLRSKLFTYEVRCTGRLAPSEESEAPAESRPESRELRESLRIVEEAVRRVREAEGEWAPPADEAEGRSGPANGTDDWPPEPAS